MKRYLAFSGTAYFPLGGWGDFDGEFDTIEEAKKTVEENCAKIIDAWGEVVDTEAKKVLRFDCLERSNGYEWREI